MTITITGNKGEFLYNIITDGEKCSVFESDKDETKVRQGRATIKGDDKPMVKTKIIETTEKYDKDGKLVEKITREEEIEDDTTTPYFMPCINHAGQCTKEAVEHAKYATSCCENVVSTVNTAKASASYA